MVINKNNSETAIVGKAYDEPKELVAKYAKKNIPLLFLGRTGSGKELFANLYMEKSERTGESRTINCSAYSDGILRSEIFGHVIGAFTGAVALRTGLIGTCKDGILFFDELDSASQGFQALILRVAANNNYTQLGSDKETPCSTLIIGAIKNISSVREDLLKRFNILPIPPLQPFDIPEIAEKYLGKPLKKRILDELVSNEYPGNVRELIKQCDKLLVEEGEKIFSATKEKRLMEGIYFDYDRFRKEIELWDKHIQPIIKKHNLVGVNYLYRNPVGNMEDIFEGIPKDFISDDFNLSHMARMIEHLKYWRPPIEIHLIHVDETVYGEAALRLLKDMLKTVIEKGYLNDLLVLLDKEPKFHMYFPKYIPESNEESDIDRRPLLNHLLDTTPYKKAYKKFQKIYAGYYVEKNDGNKTATAKELDISVRTIDNYLKQ